MSGSTNFKQHNPTQANQEDDAEYLIDSVRVNGAIAGVYQSTSFNKFAYQVTTFIAALAQSLATKGFTVNDDNITTLETVLAHIVTTLDSIDATTLGGHPSSFFQPATAADSITPPGTVAYTAAAAAGTGWLIADGSAVSRATYPDLFTAIGDFYGAGDGSTTFNLPELRGEFIRSLDDSRGVDSARARGSAQGDTMQGHVHSLHWLQSSGDGTYFGAGPGAPYGTNINTGSPISDGTNGTPRAGAETRPRNVALLAVIKY
jgi:microcystin-dependent protein